MRVETDTYSSPMGEDKDCSIRSLVAATGMRYEDAQAIFRKHGRIENMGTPHGVTKAVIAELFPRQLSMSCPSRS